MNKHANDNWKKQQRDKNGRFISLPKEKSKGQYTIKDIERAFLDGLASTGGFFPPSKKWEFYKKNRGLI